MSKGKGMGKVIKKSASPEFFAKGGSDKMAPQGFAVQAPAGTSMHETHPKSKGKFAAGGSTKMFGKGSANTAPSGVSVKSAQ